MAASASKTKPSLLKALARAHSRYASVLEGNAVDQRALAHFAGLTERYIGKVFPSAFLAPASPSPSWKDVSLTT